MPFCKDPVNCMIECIKQNKLPKELKIADITPIQKRVITMFFK